MEFLLLALLGVLVLVRWLTRPPVLNDRIQMTNERRADIIRLERQKR